MKLVDYLQNEDLCSIGVKLGTHLATDAAIKTYCEAHFGQSLNIYVGSPEAYIPKAGDTPYLFLHDFSKNEGAGITKAEYECVIKIGIATDEQDAVTEEGVRIFSGQQRISELLTLIEDALYRYKNYCQPPTRVEQLTPAPPGNNLAYWEGYLVAVWSLDIPLGGQNHF